MTVSVDVDGEQSDDSGGYPTMLERKEGVASPGAYVYNRVPCGNFCLAPVFFQTALPRSGVQWRIYYDANDA